MLKFGYNDSPSAVKFMLEALAHIPNMAVLLEKTEASQFVFTSFEESFKRVGESPAAYIIDEETGLDEIVKQFVGFPCNCGKISVFQLSYAIK